MMLIWVVPRGALANGITSGAVAGQQGRVEQRLVRGVGLVRQAGLDPRATRQTHHSGQSLQVVAAAEPVLGQVGFPKQVEGESDQRTARRWGRVCSNIGAAVYPLQRPAFLHAISGQIAEAQIAAVAAVLDDRLRDLSFVEQAFALAAKPFQHVGETRPAEDLSRSEHAARVTGAGEMGCRHRMGGQDRPQHPKQSALDLCHDDAVACPPHGWLDDPVQGEAAEIAMSGE